MIEVLKAQQVTLAPWDLLDYLEQPDPLDRQALLVKLDCLETLAHKVCCP